MQKVYRALGITFLFLVAISGTALSQATARVPQGQQVSGTVTSVSTGEKLWGVTVRVKNTQTQTVTDQQGHFALVAPTDAVLTFAQIGYRSKEAPINGQSTLDMTLEQAPTMLQEVVVTGYETQRRGDITSAVSSVNMETAQKQTSASILQRLDAVVPGVTVSNSGSPGARTTVRIRGVSSFHDNDPLYIIDGTPVQDSYINWLNPSDAQEIQVLKDASATSIYGSRASNGVVIIETKKGRPGGRQARLEVRTGVASPTRGLDDMLMQSSLQYFDVIKRAYLNANEGRVDSLGRPIPYTADSLPPEVLAIYGDPNNPEVPAYTYVNPAAIGSKDQWGRPANVNTAAYAYPNVLIMPGSAGTDWWKAVFSPAQFTDANLGVSGGGADNSYSVSFNYLNQAGTGAYSQFQRGTLRVNTAFTLNKLTIGENVAVAREYQVGGIDDNSLGEDNIVGKNILMQPVVTVYDIGGNFASGKFTGGGNNTNPLKYAFSHKDDKNINDRILGNAFGAVDLAHNLGFKTRFSFNLSQGSFNGFTPTTPENSEPVTVTSIVDNESSGTEWTWSNTFNYNWTTASHNLALLVGQEAFSSSTKFMSGGIADLLNEDPASRYIDDALGNASTKNVNNSGTFDRLLSFFGKADYNYQQRYYASATLRRDGSSKFGAGHQWGTFPAFNVGWRLSRESFFPKDGFFSNVMLRFGYGETGNQQIPGGRIVAKFGGSRGDTFYDIGGSGTSIEPGFRQTALGNPDVKWETNKSANVGVDLEFNQGRGNFTLDVYNRNTDGLLYDPRLPSTAGYADPAIGNYGEMNNKGFDVGFAYSGTIGGNKVWNISLNGGHYKNKIVSIDGVTQAFFGPTSTRIGTAVINQVGQPIGAFYGLKTNGYFPDSATALSHRTDSLGACPVAPCQDAAAVGRLRFLDVNGDGHITSADRTIIGSPHPDFTGGVDLGFRTGAWDFSATFFGSFGNQIFDAQKDFYVFRDFSTNVMKDRLTNSFCLPADEGCTHPYDQNAKYPRLDQFDASSPVISSYYVEDGSYVRLRMLQVGWTVPANMIKFLPSARIYLQGENLLTITGYEGLDPALPAIAATGAAGDVRDQARGIDIGTYPTNRVITIGISTTF